MLQMLERLTELTGKPKLRAIIAKLYPGVPGFSESALEEGDDNDGSGLDGTVGPIRDWPPYDIDDALAEL